jgi:5-methylthioribose kinase
MTNNNLLTKNNILTTDGLSHYILERLPEFHIQEKPLALSGGNLNFVWRVAATPQSIIVKYAPPYLAAQPDVPLDVTRIHFEHQALKVLAPEGLLGIFFDGVDGINGSVTTPRVLDFNSETSVLLMQDMGPLPDLATALKQSISSERVEILGENLGQFLGRLHSNSFGSNALADLFRNEAIQIARARIQYQQIRTLASEAGLRDTNAIGTRAEKLGEKFSQSGICLVMGDLWPASILIDDTSIRLIDWEFANFGWPAQDLGHLAAHVWMQAQCASDMHVTHRWQAFWQAFYRSYKIATKSHSTILLSPETLKDCRYHVGAEILMRSVGPFNKGYVYEGLSHSSDIIQKSLEVARKLLTDTEVDFFPLSESQLA